MSLQRIYRGPIENVLPSVERWRNGHYMPKLLLDELGRRLIVLDLREVERRLLAREKKDDN